LVIKVFPEKLNDGMLLWQMDIYTKTNEREISSAPGEKKSVFLGKKLKYPLKE
jgi:hypothetical protein